MKKIVVLLALCIASSAAYGRDGYGDRPMACDPTQLTGARLTRCQEWIANVKQPDNREVSCCAESDSYITDDFVVRNGQLFAVTTVAYPDVPKGTRIPIPNNKINNAAQDGGNPSGHSITFAAMENAGNNPTFLVYCYLGGTLG